MVDRLILHASVRIQAGELSVIVPTPLLPRKPRTVFRCPVLGLAPQTMVSPQVIGASKDRIWVRHHSAGLAVECCLAYHASRFALAFLPLEGLLDIGGDDDAPVLLETQATGKTLTCWSVEGIAQSRESWFPSLAELTPFPRLPGAFPRVPLRFSGALYEADALVEEAARRGVPHGARLQGSAGEIVAGLDGQDRQILHRLQRGRDP